MITIEVGPRDTAEIIAQRYPDVFDWREGVLFKRAGIGDVRVVRTAEDGDVYDAPLRNPLVDAPEICGCNDEAHGSRSSAGTGCVGRLQTDQKGRHDRYANRVAPRMRSGETQMPDSARTGGHAPP